jgi:acyl carrier protein
MTRGEILQRIQEVGAGTFGCAPETLQETTAANDVENWNSLRHLIFISQVEEEFQIELNVGAIGKLTNIADLVTMVHGLKH